MSRSIRHINAVQLIWYNFKLEERLIIWLVLAHSQVIFSSSVSFSSRLVTVMTRPSMMHKRR